MSKFSSGNIEAGVTVTHKSRPAAGKEGMKHIIQPRGDGTDYRFNIRTPSSLKGMIDPSTGKKFGTYIKRSLGGTRHLPTAKKLRDIRLAEVRAMEADAKRGAALGDRFSLEKASAWADPQVRSRRRSNSQITQKSCRSFRATFADAKMLAFSVAQKILSNRLLEGVDLAGFQTILSRWPCSANEQRTKRMQLQQTNPIPCISNNLPDRVLRLLYSQHIDGCSLLVDLNLVRHKCLGNGAHLFPGRQPVNIIRKTLFNHSFNLSHCFVPVEPANLQTAAHP